MEVISVAEQQQTDEEPTNRSQLLPEGMALDSNCSVEDKPEDVDQKTQKYDVPPVTGSAGSHSCLQKFFLDFSPPVMCPAMTKIHFLATRVEILAMLGALLYVVISFSWAEPIHNPALQLAALFVLAQVFGAVAGVARLPPLLGMLLAGLLLRNVNIFHAEGAFLKFTASLRACAMTVILLRAGLGLDASALRRLSLVVIRLAILPCVTEAITVAFVSHYLLNFPWQWGFLLGFVLGAVSPAVVVPSLLALQSDGYGENKGIATLVIASSSIDDIIAITLFGVFLSTIFSHGSITEMLMQGPLEVVIGITWGILMGVISIYIPHCEEESAVKLRTLMVSVSGLLSILGSQLIGYAGAGPLGCLAGAFVASSGWRAFSPKNTYEPVMLYLTECWLFLQPFLFGLIGTEIDLTTLEGKTVGLGMAVVLIALLIRILVCCLSVLGSGLNVRETLFVGLAWLPKATVQAAIGPVALDLARNTSINQEQNISLAKCVLTIAVLAILVTAPLGAIGILRSGPILLTRSEIGKEIFKRQSDSSTEQEDGGNAGMPSV